MFQRTYQPPHRSTLGTLGSPQHLQGYLRLPRWHVWTGERCLDISLVVRFSSAGSDGCDTRCLQLSDDIPGSMQHEVSLRNAVATEQNRHSVVNNLSDCLL